MLERVFYQVLLMSFSGGITGFIVLYISSRARRRLDSKWNYYIFLIPLLLLLIPFKFGNEIQIIKLPRIASLAEYQLIPAQETAWNKLNENIAQYKPVTASQKEILQQKTSVQNSLFNRNAVCRILSMVWLVVAIAVLLYKLAAQVLFERKIEKLAFPPTEMQIRTLGALKHKTNIRLKVLPGCGTPFMTGIINPVIYIPDIDISEHELYFVLRHEITHIRRYDLLYKLLASLAAALHFFNPAVYFIQDKIHILCEFSCDEAVTEQMSLIERKDYGKTILCLMKRNNQKLQAGAALCGNEKNITERIEMIMKNHKITVFTKAISFVLICIVTFGSLVFASAVNSLELRDTQRIAVSYAGQKITFKNKPLIENETVYLPLRETLNACGIGNENIYWVGGNTIALEIFSPSLTERARNNNEIGSAENYNVMVWVKIGSTVINLTGKEKSITQPVLLKDGVAYAPIDVFLCIKSHVYIENNNEIFNLELLEELSVIVYTDENIFPQFQK